MFLSFRHGYVHRVFSVLVAVILGSGFSFGASEDSPTELEALRVPQVAGALSGVWVLTITFDPNPVLPETIKVLGNFTRDGSFISSTDLPRIPITSPTLELGVGHGAWQRVSWGIYELEEWRFATLSDGTVGAIARGKSTVERGNRRDQLKGTIELQLFDLNSNALAPPALGMIEGQRLGPAEFPLRP